MYDYAFVNSEGEIRHLVSPGDDNDFTHLQDMGNGITAIQIDPLDFDQDMMNTKWWNFSTGQWATREAGVGSYYDWIGGAWVLNSSDLWDEIRGERGQKLTDSDWTQMPDAQITAEKKAEWATYRQALRDLPANQPDVTETYHIVWPTEPS